MKLFGAYLLALPAYCLFRTTGNTIMQDILTFAIPILLGASCLAHAVDTLGWRRAGLLFVTACAIAFAAEWLGSSTGLIFGSYQYSESLGFKLLGSVPWLIPLAWFMVAYPSWFVAGLLSQSVASRIAIAALAVTTYDLSLEPRMVADGAWIWRDHGLYFGVPLSNFVGWFVTASAIFTIWTLITRTGTTSRSGGLHSLTPQPSYAVHDRPQSLSRPLSTSFFNAQMPAIAYIVLWLGESIAQIAFWGGTTIGLVVFLGMGSVAAPAVLKLRKIYREAAGQSP